MKRLAVLALIVCLAGCAVSERPKTTLSVPAAPAQPHAKNGPDGSVVYDAPNAKLLRAWLKTIKAQLDAMEAALQAAGVDVVFVPTTAQAERP